MLGQEATRRFQLLVDDHSDFVDVYFKASHGWCSAFCVRHDLAIDMQTTIAQNTPVQYGEIVKFLMFLCQLHYNQYSMSSINNYDETLVWFENVGT